MDSPDSKVKTYALAGQASKGTKESSKTFYAERPELLAAYQQLIPLQRLARPEDVCDAIDFLCSPRASYITGQTVVVDGGLSLAMPHAAVRMQVDHSHP